MPNVVRFTLSTARNLDVPGAGSFISGVLDVDANNIKHVARTRFLVQPFRAVEVGIVDSTTPYPSLPAVPGSPAPDPYPQYLTADEVITTIQGAIEDDIIEVGSGTGGGGPSVTVNGVNASALAIASATASDIGALVDGRYVKLAQNLSDLPSAATARTNLGLGTAAVLAAGTASGAATLDGSGQVPLSQLGNVGSTAYVAAVDPSIQGLNTWSVDPAAVSAAGVLTAGIAQYIRLRATKTESISNIYLHVGTAASGLTAGIIAFKDAAGVTLGTAPDQATAWGTTGTKTATFASSIAVTAGTVYYVALLAVGTTGPNLARGGSYGIFHSGITSAPYRFSQSGSGQTSIPGTTTMTGLNQSGNSWFVGVGV